jgi:putative ABC transport system substrate-binding protein
MDRRAFISVVGASIVAASHIGEAQQAGRILRMGYLAGSSPFRGGPKGVRGELPKRLRELGWVEGDNIVFEARFAEGRYERLPDLAAELVGLKVDVIVAIGSAAATAAKKVTRTIPILMVSVGDPVGLGLVTSLARPGGNITGLAYGVGVETIPKSLELLKQAVQGVRQVAVLSNPANPSTLLVIKEVNNAARSLGVGLQLLEARGPHEFDGAFAAMVKERAGALLVVTEAMFSPHTAWLVSLSAKSKLPSMYGHREYVDAGGLMSYGASLDAMLGRAAVLVDQILKGAQPAGMPVEQPTQFELVINAKTAKTLGLSIPQSILVRADEIIQ